MNRLNLALVSAAALLLGACSTSPKYAQFFQQQGQALRGAPVAIVADGCVIRDEVGDDYLLRAPSLKAQRAVAELAADGLRQRGYTISRSVQPFLCGSLTDDVPPIAVVDGSKAEAGVSKPVTLPIVTDTSLASDDPLKQAYRTLLERAAAQEATLDRYEPEGDLAKPLDMGESEARLLREHLGAGRVWVVSGLGAEVSASKAIGVGLLSAIPSLLIGGPVITTVMPVDGQRYEVALIDLDARALVWKKSAPARSGTPADDDAFSGEWMNGMLEPFFAPLPGTSVASAAPKPAAAPVAPPAAPPAAQVATVTPAVAVATAAPVPAVQASAPAPASASAPRMVKIYARPVPDAVVLADIAQNAGLERGSPMRNASGEWVYVKAGGKSGWVRGADLAP